MNMSKRLPQALVVAVVVGFGTAMAHAKERELVTISYVLPAKQGLPPDVRTMTVIDFGATSNEPQPYMREPKWSAIGADIVESMLRASGADGGSLIVAQRSQTRPAMWNQGGGTAGLLSAEAATRVGSMLTVNGLVVGQIQIRIDDRGRRSKVNWDRVLGGVGGRPNQGRYEPRYQRDGDRDRDRAYYRGSRGNSPRSMNLSRGDIEEVNRALSVQCTMQLLDSATGRPIAQYNSPPLQRRDRRPPVFNFGRYLPDTELNPIDHFIGELVERAAQEFVSTITPTRVEVVYELVGSGKDFERGLRHLRQGDHRRAYEAFEDAHQDERDDAEYPFAMGVTAELMGDLPRALENYRRATTSKDIDDDELPQYLDARDRLADHLNRGPMNTGGFIDSGPVGPVQPYNPPQPYSPPPRVQPSSPPPGQHAGRNCLSCGYGPITYALSRCPRCGRHPDQGPGSPGAVPNPPVVREEPPRMEPEMQDEDDRRDGDVGDPDRDDDDQDD